VLLLSMAALYLSSELLIRGSRALASYAGWSREAMGAVLISISTAAPEVLTGAISSLRGAPQIGVGTLLGSTVVVTTFVPSLLVLVNGGISSKGSLGGREALVSTLSSATAVFLLLGGVLDRYTGLALMAGYTIYVYYIARGEAMDQNNPPNRVGKRKLVGVMLMLVLSSLLIYVSAEYSVDASLGLAAAFAIPDFIVGVLILGIGVELPEIVISLLSSGRGDKGMALGSVLGSNTAKALLGLGVMGALSGDLAMQPTTAVLSSAFFALISPALLYVFMRRGADLSKLDALPLLVVYVLYVFLVV